MRIIQGGYGQQVGASVGGATQNGAANRPAGDASKGAQKTESTCAEKVTLSDRARQLAEQSAAADTQKVTSLRSAIENGTFTIDRQAIANHIVNGD
jgi:flagellar biosynthesis anti-sigma factor FlgM